MALAAPRRATTHLRWPVWTAAVAMVALGLLILTQGALGQQTYRVVDADRDPYTGIYLRDGTSMASVRRTTDRHVRYGRSVTLVCGTNGDAVGPYNNRRWHRVTVVDGPTQGQQGWLPDRYLNTPNRANQRTPGEPECSSPSGQPDAAPRAATAAAYFSPGGASDVPGAPLGVQSIGRTSWSLGVGMPRRASDCISSKAANAVHKRHNGRTVTTLAGWSLGRMGPIYAIGRDRQLRRQVNFILIYDPGSLGDMTPSCDPIVGTSKILHSWLSENTGNRLMILAGARTKDSGSGGSHQGIQRVWLSHLRGEVSRRVTVCNFDRLGHRETLASYAHLMAEGPRSTCPPGATGWHP